MSYIKKPLSWDIAIYCYSLPIDFWKNNREAIEDILKSKFGLYDKYHFATNELIIRRVAKENRAKVLLPILYHLENQDHTQYILKVMKRRPYSVTPFHDKKEIIPGITGRPVL